MRLTTFAGPFVLATMTLAAQADAASSEAKRKLQDIDTALRDVSIEEQYKKAVPPLAREIERAERAYEDVHVGVERARAALGQVPVGDNADPAVVAATKRVKDWVAYEETFKKNLDAAKNVVKTSHAQAKAFLAENEAAKSSVMTFAGVVDGNPTAMAPGVEGLKEVQGRLAQLDATCKAKWKDVVNPPEGGLDVQPKTWCEIAAKRNEWIAKLVAADLAFERGKKEQLLDGIKSSIQGKEGFFTTGFVGGRQCVDGVTACRAILEERYAPLFEVAGVKIDPNLLAPTLKKVEEVTSAIDRQAPTLAYPVSAIADGALLGLATKVLKESFPTARVTRAGWTGNHTIQTGPLGTPVSRSRWGVAELKVPGEKWCRLVKVATTEAYAGGGRYVAASPSNLSFGDIRFERCK